MNARAEQHHLTEGVGAKRPGTSTTLLIALVCVAQFMVILDVSIVNIALPSIGRGLRFSPGALQWVVNAYTIGFAGFLMLGGRAADLFGRRRLLLGGVAMFVLCSIVCALSDSQATLVSARALQGLAGALLSPASLSIITSSLPEGPERNRGVALWGAVGGLGGSSGALLGGILTQALGWRAIFAVNVPIGAAVLIAGLIVIERDRPSERRGGFDLAGAVLITASLALATYGATRAATLGFGAAAVLIPLALSLGTLLAFLFVEARIASAPLVPLHALTHGRLRGANAVMFLLYAASFPLWYFLTLFLQDVSGFDPLLTGLACLPMTLAIFTASALAPRLLRSLPARAPIVAGLALTALGMLLLRDLAPHADYLLAVLPGSMLAAIGMGLALVPTTLLATAGLPASLAGLGSGLLNTERLMGGAVGLAVLASVAAPAASAPGGAGAALSAGFDRAFLLAAALSLAGALIAARFLRHPAAPSAGAPRAATQEPLVELAPAVPDLSDRESAGKHAELLRSSHRISRHERSVGCARPPLAEAAREDAR